jgi:hypothetical protein
MPNNLAGVLKLDPAEILEMVKAFGLPLTRPNGEELHASLITGERTIEDWMALHKDVAPVAVCRSRLNGNHQMQIVYYR